MYGGADAKMKKFPSIGDYLQVKHKKVYEALENLSMENSLKPRRGGAITFIIPDDKYLATIDKIIHGPNPEDATNIISALTLQAYIPDLASMNKFQKDIPNGLGKKLIIKKIEGKAVEVDSGSLTLDEDFVPFAHVGGRPRGNMAVWKLKGTLNLDTPKATYEFSKEAAGKKGAKRGGADDPASSEKLQRLITSIKIAKRNFVLNGPDAGMVGGAECCPFAKACDRLVAAWRKDEGAFKEQLAAAQCLLSGEPTIDFFMLFCNPLVFPADRVIRAYESIPDGSESICHGAACELRCKGSVNDGSNAILLSAAGRQDYHKALSSMVVDLLKGNTLITPKRLESLYAAADMRNRLVDPTRDDRLIMGDKDLWPVALSRAFSQHKGLHQALDETSYMIYMDLKTMVSRQDALGDPLNPARRAYRAKCYDELFRCLESIHAGWAIRPATIFNQVVWFQTENRALPEIFRCFAMCCLMRCHCDLTIVGAGKRHKSRKGRGEADDSSSSDDEPEEEKETSYERASLQRFSEAQAASVAGPDRSPVVETARMLSLLSPKQMDEAVAMAKERQ